MDSDAATELEEGRLAPKALFQGLDELLPQYSAKVDRFTLLPLNE